jgi:sensor histidine kinase YesM
MLWHVIFWLAILSYYTLFFGHQGGYYWYTMRFVAIMLPVAIGTTYLFNYYLIPKFLFTKKIKTFILLSFYAFVCSFYLISLIIFPFLILNESEVNFATLDKSFLDIYFLVVGLYAAILIAILIKLIKYSYERQNLHLQLLREKTDAELQALRSQINPHFLFNTLNNIYTLSLKKSDQTAEVVMKLSEMLDYLLYRCNADKVLLKEEIKLIENYLYLQQIRFDKRLKIDFEIAGKAGQQMISPMMLLPFVENSFKHGIGKQRNTAWIKIILAIHQNSIDFQVKNSNNKVTSENKQNTSGGIGLSNVKKRLDLIYKNTHELHISNNDEEYSIELKLTTAA